MGEPRAPEPGEPRAPEREQGWWKVEVGLGGTWKPTQEMRRGLESRES